MLFVIAMTGWGMILNSINFYLSKNWLLFVVNGIIIVFVIWMIIEVISVVKTASYTRHVPKI